MEKKVLRVGFDFDGVIMYNPARVIRPFMAFLKLKKVVKRQNLHFYKPKQRLMQLMWWLAHQSSLFPARGLQRIKTLVQQDKMRAFVITGRFSMLKKDLQYKLTQLGAQTMFTKCYITANDEQPHLYKAKMIKNLQLDVYVEDNWDIVQYLDEQVGDRCTIIWLSNWIDNKIDYHHKVTSMNQALDYIEEHYVKQAK